MGIYTIKKETQKLKKKHKVDKKKVGPNLILGRILKTIVYVFF